MRNLAHTAAEDLLKLMMRRYERASTILTSNRPVNDWGKLLGDTAALTALDRLSTTFRSGPTSWTGGLRWIPRPERNQKWLVRVVVVSRRRSRQGWRWPRCAGIGPPAGSGQAAQDPSQRDRGVAEAAPRRRGSLFERGAPKDEEKADVNELYRKTGQLEMERDFLATRTRAHLPDSAGRKGTDPASPVSIVR